MEPTREEEMQIYTSEVDPLWVGTIKGEIK